MIEPSHGLIPSPALPAIAGLLRALVLICPLTACAVHPDYQRPALAVQPRWENESVGLPRPESSLQPLVAEWWHQLGDPGIDQLVEHSLADNPTLQEALARVDQARAQVATERAAGLPRIDLAASAVRSQIGDTDVSGRV